MCYNFIVENSEVLYVIFDALVVRRLTLHRIIFEIHFLKLWASLEVI